MSVLSFLETMTAKQADGYLASAEKLFADVRAAIKAKGANVHDDLQVGIDVADDLSGLPVIGPDAALAAKGLLIMQFILDHGVPHNSGEGGIGARPEGNGFDVGGA